MRGLRPQVWVPLAAAAGLLVALSPPEGGEAVDVVQSVSRGTAPVLTDPAKADAAEAVLRVRQRLPEAEAEPMGSTLWRLGPSEQAPVAVRAPRAASASELAASAPPAPPPAAPEPPFRVIGRYVDGEREGVILQAPDGGLVIAHSGDRLGDTYQVESLTGNRMVLNYLPLNERQSMDIGIAR